VRVAAECGANTYKSQWTSNAESMAERRHAAAYLPWYRWLAYPLAWHHELADLCHTYGMDYACSIYLPEDAAAVAPWVISLKIASFEAQDLMLVKAARATGLQTIGSTGMLATDQAVQLDVDTLLLCTSAYPAPVDSLQVGAMRWYDGLSDHSRHVLTGAVAVGAGARVLEAHYRLDTCDQTNPDYAVAFAPAAFARYIEQVRLAERMMGDGVKRVQPCEVPMLPYRVI
jgi:sialic acid synthase SpsE